MPPAAQAIIFSLPLNFLALRFWNFDGRVLLMFVYLRLPPALFTITD